MSDQDLKEIDSVRVYLKNIDGDSFYVDIVSEKAALTYLSSMCSEFERNSRRSISRLWRDIDGLVWEPGQKENELKEAIC